MFWDLGFESHAESAATINAAAQMQRRLIPIP